MNGKCRSPGQPCYPSPLAGEGGTTKSSRVRGRGEIPSSGAARHRLPRGESWELDALPLWGGHDAQNPFVLDYRTVGTRAYRLKVLRNAAFGDSSRAPSKKGRSSPASRRFWPKILGLPSHCPTRTLNRVIRKAKGGEEWYPMLGLPAAPETPKAVPRLILSA
jgi:hypothetical protein